MERESFLLSQDTEMHAKILEKGPLRASVRLDGLLGETKFQFTNRMCKVQRAIEVELKAWFGNPWTLNEHNKMTERR
jgi:hypothetical protein